MNKRFFILCTLCAAISLRGIAAQGVYADSAVSYEKVENYFVSNKIEPEKDSSCRQGICTTKNQFDEIFHPAAVMWRNQKFLPQNYFDTHAVVYWIEWGNTPWQYTVKSVIAKGKTLQVRYSKQGEASDTAFFSPSLVIGIEKSALKDIEKIEFLNE